MIYNKILFRITKLYSTYLSFVLISIISVELTIIVFIKLQYYYILNIEPSSAIIIITINLALFSALFSILLKMISSQKKLKKEKEKKAIIISKIITEFRNILNILTEKFGVWENDNATKKLFDSGIYKNVDYYEYKLMSKSDYTPKNNELINSLFKDSNHQNSQSDLYLSMISLVKNRNNNKIIIDYLFDPYFIENDIYNIEFIEKCNTIYHIDCIWFWFNENCNFINYSNLSSSDISYIEQSIKTIDPKYKFNELNDKAMAHICLKTSTYFKELYFILKFINRGIPLKNLFLIVCLIFCLLFGILSPLLFTIIHFNVFHTILITNILLSLNFGFIIFLIPNIFYLLRNDISLS